MSEFTKIAVPATRSSAAMLNSRRKLVLVLLLFCVASGLIGLAVALKASHDASNVVVPTEPTKAIAVAEEAGRDFLTGRTSQVPAATGLNTDWSVDADGIPIEEPYAVTSFAYSGRSSYTVGDRRPTLVHLIRFRANLGGRAYYVDVPVADTIDGPVLAETPVLLPATAGERNAAPIDYSEMYSGSDSPPANVRTSIDDWIATFAAAGTNDEDLRDITQDQTPEHTWSGLDGWSGRVEAVKSAVPVGLSESSELAAGWIVQVEVVLTPPGANGPSLRTTYDVYVVTEGNPAKPPVVAWGPAGSAEDLTALTNVN